MSCARRYVYPFISFCHCRVETKRGRICRVKYWKATLAILASLYASIAIADDFKTIKGKEYKDATVTRVEPDGIMVKTKSGISKIYFVELPKEVQERFQYDAEKAAAYSAAQNAATQKNNEQAAKEQKQQEDAQQKTARGKGNRPRYEHHVGIGISQLQQQGFDTQTAQRIWASCQQISGARAAIQNTQRAGLGSRFQGDI